jgi:uncharacterized protein YbjT (DUF2867 family)
MSFASTALATCKANVTKEESLQRDDPNSLTVGRKRLFVVGATGRVGSLVVDQALAAGHSVTAFVRDPARLPPHRNLSIVTGQVAEDLEPLAAAIKGHDAAISALGNPLWLKGLRGPAIMEASFRNLTIAMGRAGIRRIVAPLAWGAGASREPSGLLVRLIAATLIRRDYRDFDAVEVILRESLVDFTIAYFGALTDGPATTDWSASPYLETPRRLRIARADVAAFLVAAATDAHSTACRRVVLSGGGGQAHG